MLAKANRKPGIAVNEDNEIKAIKKLVETSKKRNSSNFDDE